MNENSSYTEKNSSNRDKHTRTKIVCTIGPASSNIETLRNMVSAGMDVVRLNFSHGSHESHKKTFNLIKNVSKDLGVLIDLSGPKFRIGEVKEAFDIEKGDKVILTSETIVGDKTRISVNHPNLPQEVQAGHMLYINDGLVGLKVEKITGNDIHCICVIGGPISSRKGINAPETPVTLYFPTEKDMIDAKFALTLKPDFFACSFVRRAEDLAPLRKMLDDNYDDSVKLIAKIEHRDALNNIDEILDAADGIMVARGDLGIEIPTEDVPIIQKEIISKCNEIGKPVITATQMLESMTINKRPTRAEASDVSNAVIDGTDAVMLSGETATGRYPVETINFMDKIACRAEKLLIERIALDSRKLYREKSISEVLGHDCAYTVKKLPDIKAIIAITRTGSTARLISKYRPNVPILAATSVEATARQLQLSWGIVPIKIPVCTSTDQLILYSISNALQQGLVIENDLVLIILGSILGIPHQTNVMTILNVGDVLTVSQGLNIKEQN